MLAEGLRYAALRSAEFSDLTMPESVAAAPVTPFNVWDEASLTSDLETVSAKPFEIRIECWVVQRTRPNLVCEPNMKCRYPTYLHTNMTYRVQRGLKLTSTGL
jgi:hypothetical protein